MSLDAAKHLLDEFNDGNWNEVGAYFNHDFQTFFNFLNKYNLGKYINYKDIEDVFKNEFLFVNLQNDKDETLKYICDNIVTDVYPMNGGYYLHINNRTEFPKLFRKGYRGYDSREMAEHVLGEDYWEPFDDTTTDIYDDVISVLDEGNKNKLAHYIINQIGEQDLSLDDYEESFFYELSEEQGTEGFFRITSENVMDLIGDGGAMLELLNNELSDLNSNLYGIHSNAYNTAYTDEIYNDVWSEIGIYFDKNDIQNETKKRYDGTTYTVEYFKINDFGSIIYDFLNENLDPQWGDSYLEYHGELIPIMEYMMDNGLLEWLDFRVPDYPDWSTTKKIINDIFGDYI